MKAIKSSAATQPTLKSVLTLAFPVGRCWRRRKKVLIITMKPMRWDGEDGGERDAICNASTCLFCLIESEKDEKKSQDEENGRCLVDWKYMEE
jgi:hypothetical protein